LIFFTSVLCFRFRRTQFFSSPVTGSSCYGYAHDTVDVDVMFYSIIWNESCNAIIAWLYNKCWWCREAEGAYLGDDAVSDTKSPDRDTGLVNRRRLERALPIHLVREDGDKEAWVGAHVTHAYHRSFFFWKPCRSTHIFETISNLLALSCNLCASATPRFRKQQIMCEVTCHHA
jgi:hypothetical protein